MSSTDQPRNGVRPGDVSYVTLALPDVARGEKFYSALLGWDFAPGQLGREQGGGVTPELGLWDGVAPGCETVRGAVLGFRVEDIAALVTRVRGLGGTATEAAERPYGVESRCSDSLGQPFYLHQLTDQPVDDGTDLANGRQHGDVAYVTLEVADLAQAEAFYGALFGWSFSPGSEDAQITGVTPMAGFWAGGSPGVILAYRVDDIDSAVSRVGALGGVAGRIEKRPYGLAADFCTDDQGIRFHLLQLG